MANDTSIAAENGYATKWSHGLQSLGLLALLLVTAVSVADESPRSAAKLTLDNGDYLHGKLLDSAEPNVLRWHADGFVQPFDFTFREVTSVYFPPPEVRAVPTGDYCIELVGGDLLFGKLVGLSGEIAEFDLAWFGRTQLTRSSIRRIRRWGNGADLLYMGPNGLSDWDTASPANAWQDESGHLATDRAGAFVHRDFKLAAQVAIEFEISWKNKPDFVLALGVERGNLALDGAASFRLEVWQRYLVAMRETDDEADVAALGPVQDGPGRIHMIAYLDQQQHRMIVTSPFGTKLADLQVSNGRSYTYPGICLTNQQGDVRLESLRISRWNGESPQELRAESSRLHRTDGTVVYGELKSYDSRAARFVVADKDGETLVDAAEVSSIVLPAEDTPGRGVRAVLWDGHRVSGELTGVQDGMLLLNCPYIHAPLTVPMPQLASLHTVHRESSSAIPEGQSGRLELAGVRSTGVLISGKRLPEASCLVWHPFGSATASPLVPGIAGQIVYREQRPPPKPTPQPSRRVNRGLFPALLNGFAQISSTSAPSTPSERALHLRTGDTIPCDVTSIDDKGVRFKTDVTDATFVPHDKLKAVELGHRNTPTKIDEAKQERLLTLPRMQRDNPPKHLIRSVDGDYLRATLESMDDQSLQVEVRLETKQFKRSHIAEIIWLHEDELGGERDGSREWSGAPTHVQAVRRNGTRLTFQPRDCDGTILRGESELLGQCYVTLADVDVLLIGGQVGVAAAQRSYGRWRLRPAVDPRFVSAERNTPKPLGTESAMVGKPAPDFTLELLDGTSFQLARCKGKVVVLDFWATWCGPCIQAMPQVDAVVHEFKDQGVELLAVNLQETSDAIKSTLERLRLDPAVALDIDGIVAARYAATAIPQTVIVDRDGNVARLFVGGGSAFSDQLRAALQEVLLNDELSEASE